MLKNPIKLASILIALCFAGAFSFAVWDANHTPHHKTQDNPNNSTTHYIDPRTPDERIADYTLWLERFTGLLAAISVVQIGFLIRADKATRDSIDIAKRSITESNRPWVFVENVRWHKDDKFITVIFRNSGVRPAKNFCKKIVAHVLPVPFPSSNLPIIDAGSATFLPPGGAEEMMLEKPSKIDEGYEYRIRIGLTYLIDDKNTDRLDVDFSCTRDGRVRKVTPNDYATSKGSKTYTFELEGFPLPK